MFSAGILMNALEVRIPTVFSVSPHVCYRETALIETFRLHVFPVFPVFHVFRLPRLRTCAIERQRWSIHFILQLCSRSYLSSLFLSFLFPVFPVSARVLQATCSKGDHADWDISFQHRHVSSIKERFLQRHLHPMVFASSKFT